MTYEVSMTPIGRWQVKRQDGFIMAVFATKAQAEAYCERKQEAEHG